MPSELPHSDPQGQNADPDEPDGQTPVARFQSGAEAGYFADEFARRSEIPIEIVARERFDAVHAAWSVDYLLTAPKGDASRAAQLLRDLVESSDDDRDPAEASECLPGDSPGGVWVPLVLTLAAGSIACWGVERAEQIQRPPALVDRDPRLPPHLWHLLASTPGAWRQQSPDGRATRELLVDRDGRTALLREDLNGDGTFDREWRFDWRK